MIYAALWRSRKRPLNENCNTEGQRWRLGVYCLAVEGESNMIFITFLPHRVFLLVGLFALQSLAQEFRATLQGTVTDPSNAALVEAAVSLKNVGTGGERTAKTDNAGHYIFQFLPPGSYELSIKAAGFKTEVRGGIGLSLGDNTRVDVELAIGQ